jgi:hypothetical protein
MKERLTMKDTIELTRFDGSKVTVKTWEIHGVAEASIPADKLDYVTIHYKSEVFVMGAVHRVLETYDEIKTALGWEPKKVDPSAETAA